MEKSAEVEREKKKISMEENKNKINILVRMLGKKVCKLQHLNGK